MESIWNIQSDRRGGRDLPKLLNHVSDGMVLEDTETAEELLPTQEGFFFGGTDYDQYYWDDLGFTKKRLEAVLATVEKDQNGWGWHCKGEDDWNLTLQYHSSW